MQPTSRQRAQWSRIAELGCAVCGNPQVEIHHCGTGGGGRKNHDYVIGLCYYHHRGAEGIDGRTSGHPISKRTWQEKYGTEAELHAKVMQALEMP